MLLFGITPGASGKGGRHSQKSSLKPDVWAIRTEVVSGGSKDISPEQTIEGIEKRIEEGEEVEVAKNEPGYPLAR